MYLSRGMKFGDTFKGTEKQVTDGMSACDDPYKGASSYPSGDLDLGNGSG